MTTELFWLTLTIALTATLWIPYIGNRIKELGPPSLAWFPLPDPPPKARWADRAMRAHNNAVENLVIFAPLVILVHLSGVSSHATETACMVYFFTRVGHYGFSIFGFPIPLRTVAFLVGVGCQVTLLLSLLS
ncbi:MAPEG family protein [Amphritea atlantica]|uniref:MAPEG family protein n=1 Tax=Amphritea atlantica TaxID=355243 RepID=A0A1H9L0P8_9GAMM|nr:MAPEG family protein [Amphritea atlantica]SER04593.1 MAPEG family protein [Amphritea atlantica]